MGGSGYVTERVAEAAGAKVDGGQGGNEEQPPSSLAEGSCDGGASEGAEAVAVPLIIPGEGLDKDSVPQPLMQVSPYVRQRSAVIGIVEGLASGKRYVPFDVQNGLHASQSMLKLEELERAAESSVSTIVVLKTLFYISVWYTFSTCLTLYNKTLLGDKLGKFPAPLLMNTFHFTLQAVLSKIVVCIQSRGGDVGATMTWKDYFSKVVPTALGTALDINLSNVSLVFISVTFATMCKSASPIFLLLFAFAFRLETPSIKLLLIIIIISFGILLTGLKNPITLMSYVTPAMAVVTLILSLVIDPWHDFDTNVYFDNSWHVIRSCLLMLTGGALAFFMVLTEYILISATSAVTVSIAGVVKEAVTIVVAVFYFHDPFTLLKGVGLLIIIIGVSLFNWYKYEKMKGQLRENDDVVSSSPNGAAKYVILDDMELPYDET
ncbi:hypothetical protein ZIOFF_066086 [Zingiber officinale]|uniref:Sugar phosphate transporter domain-containing protein n=1 Tax=Zingiber officinale TaxID=94328 RepID=A0A8J5KDK5_ZINOF|nr:hypothetical protein ZIOFF_066086 [Zingiber officinale]